jgi:hypothetical protein
MEYTKEEILEKIEQGDVSFFKSLFDEDFDDEEEEEGKEPPETETVYNENWGDGNDWIVVLYLPKFDLYVKLEGYYSSWDVSELTSVVEAEPYEHTETRYRAKK